MKPAPHTPINILLAGGANGFDANCVKLLAAAGYSPDDFGDHKYVQARIAKAKQDRRAYEATERAAGRKPDPLGPDPRTAMLANSQSGHLNQDALFRAPSGRGDACQNHTPPSPADARGYHSGMAPCMPMQSSGGTASDPRGTVGSPHWAVSQNEAQQNRANSGSVATSTDLSRDARNNAGVCTGDNAPGHNAQMGSLQSRTPKSQQRRVMGRANRRRQGAEAARLAAAGDLSKQSASGPGGAAGGGGAGAASGAASGSTAAECIDAWRQAATERMRQKALEKYGKDYDKTKQDANQAVTDAQARINNMSTATDAQRDAVLAAQKRNPATATQAELDAARRTATHLNNRGIDPTTATSSQVWQSNAMARNDYNAAQRGLNEAQLEARSVDCLNQQYRSLCSPPPPPPPSPGAFTPPNPASFPPLTGIYP